jgi:hypothetical protein
MRTLERQFWNDRGELQAGEISFTNTRGEIVGRPYVREYARRKLARWADSKVYTLDVRKRVLAETVDSDEWLGFRAGMLPSAIARDAEMAMFEGVGFLSPV